MTTDTFLLLQHMERSYSPNFAPVFLRFISLKCRKFDWVFVCFKPEEVVGLEQRCSCLNPDVKLVCFVCFVLFFYRTTTHINQSQSRDTQSWMFQLLVYKSYRMQVFVTEGAKISPHRTQTNKNEHRFSSNPWQRVFLRDNLLCLCWRHFAYFFASFCVWKFISMQQCIVVVVALSK